MQIINGLSSKHKITLYAPSGSSLPQIKVIDLGLPPFKYDANIADNDWITKATLGMKQLYIGELMKHADEFDLIHLQTEPIYLGMSYSRIVKTPILFTSHNSYHPFEKDIFTFYDKKIYFSALSHNQASQYPLTQDVPVVYNGISVEQYPFSETSNDYFLYLGRLHEDKGIANFLALLQQLPQRTFLIAGKGSSTMEQHIHDRVNRVNNAQYLGMLPHESKEWFRILSQAKALIMPITYEDSCPLVPLEAMACGTPVIAYARGSLPELVLDGKTGYLVNSAQTDKRGEWQTKQISLEGLIEATEKISLLSEDRYKQMRQESRKHIESTFTIKRMIAGYEAVYENIIRQSE